MNIFRRKKQERKPLPDNATTFQKLMHNPRTRAAMKLGLYFLFILILVIFISFAPRNDFNQPEPVDLTITEKKYNLMNANYTFEWQVQTPNHVVSYHGQKQDGIITGLKRIPGAALVEFKIVAELVYNTLYDPPILITNLFDQVNADYLNLSFLFSLLAGAQFSVDEQNYIYQPIILNEDLRVYIKIYTTNNNITQITISEINDNQESVYSLRFTIN